jgi:hypothetical protein
MLVVDARVNYVRSDPSTAGFRTVDIHKIGSSDRASATQTGKTPWSFLLPDVYMLVVLNWLNLVHLGTCESIITGSILGRTIPRATPPAEPS